MTTQPTAAPWLNLTHEVRAEVAGPITAATLAAFAIIVPDQAEVEVSKTYDGPDQTGHRLVATWDHEEIDNIERRQPGFDIGADIRQRPVDYALVGPHVWGQHTGSDFVPATPLEGAVPKPPCVAEGCRASYGHVGEHWYGDERRSGSQRCDDLPGCYKPFGHDGEHRIPDRENMPGKGNWYAGACPDRHQTRPCIRRDGHDGAHVYGHALPVADQTAPAAANDQ